MSEKKKYDSTVARIAGNILSGQTHHPSWDGSLTDNDKEAVVWAVAMARAIVKETQRTDPPQS